jgi:hypothetical protein
MFRCLNRINVDRVLQQEMKCDRPSEKAYTSCGARGFGLIRRNQRIKKARIGGVLATDKHESEVGYQQGRPMNVTMPVYMTKLVRTCSNQRLTQQTRKK